MKPRNHEQKRHHQPKNSASIIHSIFPVGSFVRQHLHDCHDDPAPYTLLLLVVLVKLFNHTGFQLHRSADSWFSF